jgi:predicted TPR repeat methyltransferase
MMGNIDKFDMIAEQYDTPERITVAKRIADTIREYVADGASKSAIDYGCGTGLVGLRLLDVFSSMLFVDASENMVRQVKSKLQRLGAKATETLCYDFMTGVPAGLKADCIIAVQVLLHEIDVAMLLAHLRDALNDGGQLIVVDFDKNGNVTSPEVHGGFEQEDLADILYGLSFSKIRSETFYYGEKLLLNQDASLFIMAADYKESTI